MALIKNDTKIGPYTYKEIVENNYPDFWNASAECIKQVNIWQQMIVELLDSWKKLIQFHSNERNSENAQITLLNYLKLRSIYGFAYYIWKEVNRLCHELGVSDNNNNQDDINQAEAALISLFETFNKIDIFEITQDDTTGLDKLEQTVAGFGTRTNFSVLDKWWFIDIIRTIKKGSICLDENLWESALNDTIPTIPNVGGLMESAGDNKMVRIY